ncbi:hypothetical protein OIO90_004957 [Microbotryomycetes sp. JL221]|nr:hypothetical protein OIO90_004957 [Microbotryomycetes sp. JL221]
MATQAQAALEASLKSTIHALSLVVAFHATVDSLGVTSYVQHAPKQLINNLQTELNKFDGLCDQLEHTILRSVAVLERDALKQAGLPLPSDTKDVKTSQSEHEQQDLTMEDDFLNNSLFGDTPANSRPTTSSGLGPSTTGFKPTESTSTTNSNALGLSLPMTSSATQIQATTAPPSTTAQTSSSLAPFATGDKPINATDLSTMLLDPNKRNSNTLNANIGSTIDASADVPIDINALLHDALNSSASLSSNSKTTMTKSTTKNNNDTSGVDVKTQNDDMQVMLDMIEAANLPTTTSTNQTNIPSVNSVNNHQEIDLSTQEPLQDLSSIDLSSFDFNNSESLDELLKSFGNS